MANPTNLGSVLTEIIGGAIEGGKAAFVQRRKDLARGLLEAAGVDVAAIDEMARQVKERADGWLKPSAPPQATGAPTATSAAPTTADRARWPAGSPAEPAAPTERRPWTMQPTNSPAAPVAAQPPAEPAPPSPAAPPAAAPAAGGTGDELPK